MKSNAKAKNVLLITADQWRGECLSMLGHPCVKTPNLDALAADGVAFRRHFAACAPCGPSRASLLTGMSLQNHRSVRNGTPLDERHSNIALEVRKAGYDPVLFGYTDTSLDPRYHGPDEFPEGYEGLLPGFRAETLLSESAKPWLADLRARGVATPDTLHGMFKPVPGHPLGDAGDSHVHAAPPAYTAEDSQTAFLTRRLIGYLEDRQRTAPKTAPGWFAHLAYIKPHPPFIAPEPYNTMYDPAAVPRPIRAATIEEEATQHPWLAAALAGQGSWFDPWHIEGKVSDVSEQDVLQIRAIYYGLISKVDAYIGRIVEHLKNTGAYDDTMIVFTSDHGEMLGDRWLFGKRGWFDEGYRIPLIVKMPGAMGGRSIDAFSESIDIMPTVLDCLGLGIPRQCDGASLLPLIEGRRPDDWRTEAHWEYDFRDVESGYFEKALSLPADHCTMNVIRGDRYKYVHFTAMQPLFFDRESDPYELNNLAADPAYAPLVLEYAQKMLSWRMANDERELTGLMVLPGRVIGA